MGLFKAYDIRGIYGRELTDAFAYDLGKTIVLYTKPKSVVIGYDSRTSNLRLFSAFSRAFIEQGIDVIHAGLVTRPMLNWIAFSHHISLGIIISASHNPREYNGFKFLWNSRPLAYDNGLQHVEKLMAQKAFATLKPKKKSAQGKIISRDYIDEYVAFLSSHYTAASKKSGLHIVADVSNGAAGEIVKRLLEKYAFSHTLLFAEPDGNFPCHNPNPLDNNALIVLSNTVIKEKADFGFIVDPDADRVRFVDECGKIVDNSYIQTLVAKQLLRKHKHAAIVHDMVSRRVYAEIIRRSGGKEIVSKVGTAYIIENMLKNKAVFGSEASGHCYFKTLNSLDSGLLMMVQVTNLLSSENKRLSTLVKPLNKYDNLNGEMNYHVKNNAETLQKIYAHYKKNKKKLHAKISTLDGVSVVMRAAWFSMRASNTEPLLRLRVEGKTRKDAERLKQEIEKLIHKHA